jgi:thioredoxin-related protein
MKFVMYFLFIFIIFVSCKDTNESSEDIIDNYLQTTFHITHFGSEKFLIFTCKGCITCEKNGFNFIKNRNEILDCFKYIIVSRRFLNQIGEENNLLNNKFLVDNKDQIEKIDLPLGGALSIRFQDGRIKSIINLTPEYLLNGRLESFFRM